MPQYRAAVAALLVVAALSGCTIQDQYEATAATVGDDALAATGYELATSERIVRNRTDAGDSGRNVTVVSYLRAYTREVQVGNRDPRELAGFLVVSTPSVTVYGDEQNPVADRSERELLDRYKGRLSGTVAAGDLRDISRVGERTVTILGEEATVVRFTATATVNGESVEMTVEIAKVFRDDYVVVAAAYPSRLADEEQSRVEQLLGGLQHG